MEKAFGGVNPLATNVTPTTHTTSYPAISPSRPELSQAGRTVLITGGSAGIGYAAATAFMAASASIVIITGRRQASLDTAVASLTALAAETKTPTRIIGVQSDARDLANVDALWDNLAAQNIIVDVLVTNAARFTQPNTLFDLGVGEVWAQFETNVRAPLQFAERLWKQKVGRDRPKNIVNISTEAINMSKKAYLPISHDRQAYGLTKGCGTWLMQSIAEEMPAEKLQIVSLHPGVVYTEAMSRQVPRDFMTFDDDTLSGSYSVWAASKEARFLHGRFVWASWDVEELAEIYKQRLEEDVDFLRVGVIGLAGANYRA
ncbi:hypothetical protein B0T17DRAFT_482322 [Bombardia bombarda]|uniref:Uncharacterized protein n=1 Tax=Bombardia bombarda TaxID=252184 RepID=A0AA39XNU4_9PEZI|nr:hypothetical protein B0T17DRAFT_482322 [Bombardia bombarda]